MSELSAEQAAVASEVMGKRGRIPTPFKVWLQRPALAGRMHQLGLFLATDCSLSSREQKIAILRIAAHWGAEYVIGVQSKEARLIGISQDIIDALKEGRAPELDTVRELCVWRLVDGACNGIAAEDSEFNLAVQELGHGGIAELLALCGYFTSVALAMKLYRVTPT